MPRDDLNEQRRRLNERLRSMVEDTRLPEATRARLRKLAGRDLLDDLIGQKRNVVRLDRHCQRREGRPAAGRP